MKISKHVFQQQVTLVICNILPARMLVRRWLRTSIRCTLLRAALLGSLESGVLHSGLGALFQPHHAGSEARGEHPLVASSYSKYQSVVSTAHLTSCSLLQVVHFLSRGQRTIAIIFDFFQNIVKKLGKIQLKRQKFGI